MRKRTLIGGTAIAASAAALGAFAATGFGGGPTGAPAAQHVDAGRAAVVPSGTGAARAMARRGTRAPVVTHFITRDPVPAAGDQSTFVALRCPRPAGQPLGGGVVTNGAEGMASSVVSRFNPNNGNTPKRTFFVGARNDTTLDQEFHGTLVCGKRLRVR